jgi:hypothetical protein
LAFERVPIAKDRRRPLTRAMHKAAGYSARWRLDHDVYGAPLELWMKNALTRALETPKPKVDAQQLEAEAVTC